MTTTTTVDPFADLEPGEDGLRAGRLIYRQLARELHPDANGSDADMAALTEAWRVAERRLKGLVAPVVVKSKRHTYTVQRPLVAGYVADLHVAEMDGDEYLLKVVRDQRNADLLAAEAASLKAIHAKHEDGRNGWFPWIEESFAFAAPGKPRRRCNVIEPLHGFYNLREVAASRRAIHSRDVAWIARRVLHALAMTHEAGRIHGGLVPEHVMVHPAAHRIVLVGWGGSVEVGQPVKVCPSGPRPGYVAWLPPEVLAKEPAQTETDLYMFGRLLDWAADGRLESSRRLGTFGRGCAFTSRSKRPQDAHEVLAEFDDLLERMWGARTYHEFSMPGPSRI